MVGQIGGDYSYSGGGGGTFVTKGNDKTSATPLIIAGGGGGIDRSYYSSYCQGTISTSGQRSGDVSSISINGNGGWGDTQSGGGGSYNIGLRAPLKTST